MVCHHGLVCERDNMYKLSNFYYQILQTLGLSIIITLFGIYILIRILQLRLLRLGATRTLSWSLSQVFEQAQDFKVISLESTRFLLYISHEFRIYQTSNDFVVSNISRVTVCSILLALHASLIFSFLAEVAEQSVLQKIIDTIILDIYFLIKFF